MQVCCGLVCTRVDLCVCTQLHTVSHNRVSDCWIFLKGITQQIESLGPWRQEAIIGLLHACAKGGQPFKEGLQCRMSDLDGQNARWSRCMRMLACKWSFYFAAIFKKLEVRKGHCRVLLHHESFLCYHTQ